MTIFFRSCRMYVARDKDYPRQRWLVFCFRTSGGDVFLIRRM